MYKVKNNKGFTLLELIICLAVLGILVSSFLGVQLSFSKYNQISSSKLKAGFFAGNLYEKAKGMSISELSEITSRGIICNKDIQYIIEAERYFDNNQSMKNNMIDLVVNTDSTGNYNCYGFGDSIHEIFTLSGQGSIRIDIYSDEYRTNITFTDVNGEQSGYHFATEKQIQIINIYSNSEENANHFIHVNIVDHSKRILQIYIYENPLHKGNVTTQCNNQSISTSSLIQPFIVDNISIYSRKTKIDRKIPINLKILGFQQDREKPICQRQGIIWIKP